MLPLKRLSCQHAGCAGGIAVRVVMILATLLVVGGAIVFYLSNLQKNQELYQRKALQICEYGLQLSLEKMVEQVEWSRGFPRTPYDGGWFEVRIRKQTLGDTVWAVIESKGHRGSMTRKKQWRLYRIASSAEAQWIQQSVE